MLTNRPIGHEALLRKFNDAKQEILRLRNVINRRNETISKLRSDLANKQSITEMVQRPRCGCKHCREVNGGNNA
jgi:hypothetical protein